MPFWSRNNNNNQPNSWTASYDDEGLSSQGNGSNSQFGRWGSNSGNVPNNVYSNGSSFNNSNYGNDMNYNGGYRGGNQYGRMGANNGPWGAEYGPSGFNGPMGGNGGSNWGNQNRSGRNQNTWYTPFGTPGFASENLLADNPWTHNTLGYDYFDYFADQRVRGPFGVAPGSVVPPSQRHLFGRNSNNANGQQQQQRGFFHRNRGNQNQNVGNNSSGSNTSGLNKGVIPPGAAVATTNQPITSEGQNQYYERTLADGSVEKVQQQTVATTQQDIVPNARGINSGSWASKKGITTTGAQTGAAANIPTNVPSTIAQETTNVVDQTLVPVPPQYGYNNNNSNYGGQSVPINQGLNEPVTITPSNTAFNSNNMSTSTPAQKTITEKKMEAITTGSGFPLASTNNVTPTRAI